MSRVAFLDPVGGLAGDMLCAALLDAGERAGLVQEADFLAFLDGLGLDGLRASVSAARRGAFAARRFEVAVDAPQPHRTWADVRAMLRSAPLPPGARDRALAVFGMLAEAEARVHGTPPDRVHFHEVGAVDSIADVLGACWLLDRLEVERLECAPLPAAAGTVRGAHGAMPLPAPATAELLRGWPLRPGVPGHEHVTPTGAAVLAALARPADGPDMVLDAVGTGVGARDPSEYPNVLRAFLGRPAGAPASPTRVEVIAAQMDDLPGEHLPALLEALLDAGALDALAVPVLMKKGRSGLLVEALAEPGRADAVERALLVHGTTLGVRRWSARRRVLARRHVRVDTTWGPVRVKLGEMDGAVLHAKPEFEDVRALAREAGVSLHRVHSEALRALRPPGGEEGGR